MKAQYCFFVVFLIYISTNINSNAQVIIGSLDTPHEMALLELKSNNKGLLLPRVELKNLNLFDPLLSQEDDKDKDKGMIIYNMNPFIGLGKGPYCWIKTQWIPLFK